MFQAVRPRIPEHARFCVAKWRGIDVAGKHLEMGEEVPAETISPIHLHAMYRIGEIDLMPAECDPNEPALPDYEEAEYDESPDSTDEPPAKRGRGRPRKHPLPA